MVALALSASLLANPRANTRRVKFDEGEVEEHRAGSKRSPALPAYCVHKDFSISECVPYSVPKNGASLPLIDVIFSDTILCLLGHDVEEDWVQVVDEFIFRCNCLDRTAESGRRPFYCNGHPRVLSRVPRRVFYVSSMTSYFQGVNRSCSAGGSYRWLLQAGGLQRSVTSDNPENWNWWQTGQVPSTKPSSLQLPPPNSARSSSR